eukprot:4663348-Amphidinium_carterae.2
MFELSSAFEDPLIRAAPAFYLDHDVLIARGGVCARWHAPTGSYQGQDGKWSSLWHEVLDTAGAYI